MDASTPLDTPLMLEGLALLYCDDCGEACNTVEVESTPERVAGYREYKAA
jgi:hypothetical protein